jgi:hypothetical protein
MCEEIVRRCALREFGYEYTPPLSPRRHPCFPYWLKKHEANDLVYKAHHRYILPYPMPEKDILRDKLNPDDDPYRCTNEIVRYFNKYPTAKSYPSANHLWVDEVHPGSGVPPMPERFVLQRRSQSESNYDFMKELVRELPLFFDANHQYVHRENHRSTVPPMPSEVILRRLPHSGESKDDASDILCIFKSNSSSSTTHYTTSSHYARAKGR